VKEASAADEKRPSLVGDHTGSPLRGEDATPREAVEYKRSKPTNKKGNYKQSLVFFTKA